MILRRFCRRPHYPHFFQARRSRGYTNKVALLTIFVNELLFMVLVEAQMAGGENGIRAEKSAMARLIEF